jgi:hypothetical protein
MLPAQDMSPEEVAQLQAQALTSLSDLDARLGRWELQRLLNAPYDNRCVVLGDQLHSTLTAVL